MLPKSVFATEHNRPKASARKLKRNLIPNGRHQKCALTLWPQAIEALWFADHRSTHTHTTLFKLMQPQALNYARVFPWLRRARSSASRIGRVCVLRHLIKLRSSEQVSCGFFRHSATCLCLLFAVCYENLSFDCVCEYKFVLSQLLGVES